MAKYLQIEMPDKSLWRVPVDIIAKHRATFYSNEYDGNLEKSLKEDTLPFFDEDEFEIIDWARNNMNWSDFKGHAFLHEHGEVDYQKGLLNGEAEIVND